MSEYPLQQVPNTSHLSREDMQGWVILDEHLIRIEWKLKKPSESVSSTKNCASEFLQKQRSWKGRLKLSSGKFDLLVVSRLMIGLNNLVAIKFIRSLATKWFTIHITVHFPALDRRAHIYIGPDYEKDYENKKIWRRQGKPAVVLC